MNVPAPWGKEVRRILKRAKISEGSVADAIDFSRIAWSRYVRGKRRPDPGTVRKANSAIAKLVNIPELRDYLFGLALISGLIEPQVHDVHLEAALTLLDSFNPYFQDSARKSVINAIQVAGLTTVQIQALFFDLVAVRGRYFLFRLDGARINELPIDELLHVFRVNGAPLEQYLRSDEDARLRRVYERFELWVEAVVVSRFEEIPSSRRHDAIDAILEGFTEATTEARAIMRRPSTALTIHKANERRKPK